MSKTISHIPLSEFEHNLAHVFHRVSDEHVTVVIEDETGKRIILRPLKSRTPARRDAKKAKVDYKALAAAAGSWSDVDTDTLIRDVYENRTVTTRPLIKPV
jgi:hypothetical protein